MMAILITIGLLKTGYFYLRFFLSPVSDDAVLIVQPEESSNQSINQSINQSVNQSINQSINPSINQSIHQSVNQSINQSLNPSINQTIHQSINQSIQAYCQQENKIVDQDVIANPAITMSAHILGVVDMSVYEGFTISFFCAELYMRIMKTVTAMTRLSKTVWRRKC